MRFGHAKSENKFSFVITLTFHYICRMENERNLINEIRKGNTQAFARVVQYYYEDIVLFAASWLRGEQEVCEDIVQEVFINIWSAHHELPEMISMKPYLLKAVQNRCINHLRHFKINIWNLVHYRSMR